MDGVIQLVRILSSNSSHKYYTGTFPRIDCRSLLVNKQIQARAEVNNHSCKQLEEA